MDNKARSIFPGYTEDLHIPQEWEDVSWGNDEAPSFLVALQLRVWINHPSEYRRDGAPRFAIQAHDEINSPETDMFSTDSWEECLAFVNATTNGTILLAQFLANDADRMSFFMDDPTWECAEDIVAEECSGEDALTAAALQIFSTADLPSVERILSSEADGCPVLTMQKQIDRISIGHDIRRIADKMVKLAETYERELDEKYIAARCHINVAWIVNN